ncbi:MAG: PspA/IM30 family protein [Lachnospiraceae bacterium]|nr:PspA/IM30 family protein [Lachnospiraceae bacterium]
MGILKRFGDIMSANINALLDKAEDPEKMIDQTLRNLEKDLREVKSDTATVMAEATAAKRKLDENAAEVEKYQNYAEKALVAGNEADAKQFLEKKQALVNKQAALQQAYEAAQSNSEKMQQMHNKLQSDIATLQERRDTIKAKMSTAKAQQKINSMVSGSTDAADSIAAFDKWEAKADMAIDKANAMTELNTQNDSIDDLAAKYDAAPEASNPAVDEELAAMKAKLGIQE